MLLLPPIQGILIAAIFGLIMGNFSTSPIYRLPRREPLFIRDPYCGDCNAKLLPIDLIPVFSWLMTRGRCRYCGAPVPGAYALIEAVTCLLFVACYLRFDFTEPFVLIAFGGTTLLMLVMMLSLDNFFSDRTWCACMVMGMLLRTLQEHTIYGFAGGAFTGLLAGAAVWKLSGRPMIRDAAAFPSYLKLLVAAGIWLTPLKFVVMCVAAALALPLRKNRPWLVEWVIALSIILELLSHT